MTQERNVERLLDEWLAIGPSDVPDRVLDGVAVRIGREPQQRAWRVALRGALANRYGEAAAVAAVIVLIAASVSLLPRWQDSRIGGSNHPPSPRPVERLEAGPLVPGTYRTRALGGLEISFTVPDETHGWEAGGSTYIGKRPFTDPPDGVLLAFNRVDLVMRDACLAHAPEPVGPSVDDLAAVLAALPNADVTGPTDIEFGGARSVHVRLALDDDLSECVVEAVGLYYVGNVARVVGAGQRVDLWIVDVAGTRVVIEASHYAGASESDVRLLYEIANSVRVEPRD